MSPETAASAGPSQVGAGRAAAGTPDRGSEGGRAALPSRRRWYRWLTAVSLVGLAIRVTYVAVAKYHVHVPFNDSFYFHYQANLLVQGKGWFINPFAYFFGGHQAVQAADHPPLWTLVLAIPSAVGIQGYVSHLFWACLVGTGAVFVTGLAARRVVGPRAGLIGAGIAAVYPNYWLNDGLGMSETLVLLIVAVIVLWAFRFIDEPTWSNAAVLGGVCALGALTRSELVLLLVTILVPVGLLLRGVRWRQRLSLVALGILAALVTMAPWVGYNLARFDHPELLSNELGVTLICSNNKATYHGEFLGYWQGTCTTNIKTHGDESAMDTQYRRIAFQFIDKHKGRIPAVIAARIGREMGFFHPMGQLNFDNYLEYRPLAPAIAGLYVYYGLIVLSAGGVLVLVRRRGKRSLIPFVGLLAEVVIAAALTYGNTRFRTPVEVGLVVLTAAFVDSVLSRTWPSSADRDGLRR